MHTALATPCTSGSWSRSRRRPLDSATLAGLAAWAATAAAAAASGRILRANLLPPAPPGAGRTSLSVVVPARDEAPRVGRLVASLLRQDHADFELLVVDDRSTDGTGDVARRAAGGDPRVAVLRVDAQPEGWQGKLHALATGIDAARGELLLVLDADQELAAPDLLRRISAALERREVEAIALIARNVHRRWWDRWWIQPMVNNPLVWGVVLTAQRLLPRAPWVIGSFATRREVYEALGGAAAGVGFSAGGYDDLAWARSLAARGWRSRMVYAPDLLDATNFERFGDVVEGVSRWLAGLFSHRRFGWWGAALIGALLLASDAAAVWMIGDLLAGRVPGAGRVAVAAMIPTVGLVHCLWNRQPLAFALVCHGVSAFILFGFAAAARARWRNQVRWRGDIMQVASDAPRVPPRAPGG